MLPAGTSRDRSLTAARVPKNLLTRSMTTAGVMGIHRSPEVAPDRIILAAGGVPGGYSMGIPADFQRGALNRAGTAGPHSASAGDSGGRVSNGSSGRWRCGGHHVFGVRCPSKPKPLPLRPTSASTTRRGVVAHRYVWPP